MPQHPRIASSNQSPEPIPPPSASVPASGRRIFTLAWGRGRSRPRHSVRGPRVVRPPTGNHPARSNPISRRAAVLHPPPSRRPRPGPSGNHRSKRAEATPGNPTGPTAPNRPHPSHCSLLSAHSFFTSPCHLPSESVHYPSKPCNPCAKCPSPSCSSSPASPSSPASCSDSSRPRSSPARHPRADQQHPTRHPRAEPALSLPKGGDPAPCAIPAHPSHPWQPSLTKCSQPPTSPSHSSTLFPLPSPSGDLCVTSLVC